MDVNRTQIRTGKYKIPLKLRKESKINHKLNNFARSINAGSISESSQINLDEINDALELINDNYDTFKTIFTAPDDINVNKEIKKETAGMLIKLFNMNQQTEQDPIHVPKYNYKPFPKDLASFISAGFDEVEYNKNKGEWKDKNINDFKKLFD